MNCEEPSLLPAWKGFQDHRHRPLGHPSASDNRPEFLRSCKRRDSFERDAAPIWRRPCSSWPALRFLRMCIPRRVDRTRWRLYTGPIRIDRSMTLRAKAVRYGYTESEETRIVSRNRVEVRGARQVTMN